MSKKSSTKKRTGSLHPDCCASARGELVIIEYVCGQYAEESRELSMKIASLQRTLRVLQEQLKPNDGAR